MSAHTTQSPGDEEPLVLLFVNQFLERSMTFVHRQLSFLTQSVRVSVVTRRRLNTELFPYRDVEVVPRRRDDRWIATALRRLGASGEWTPLLDSRMRHIIRRSHPAIVHAHFGPGALGVWRAARALGVPMVITFHGYDASSKLTDKAYVRALRPMLRYAIGLTVSEEMAERIKRVVGPDSQVRPLHLGIDLDLFPLHRRTPPAEKLAAGETVTVLQVARFVGKKGHSYALRAFARLATRYPTLVLAFAGDGPLEDEARALARELGIEARVRFLGALDTLGVRSAMEEADILIQPSVTTESGDMEGVPTVLMEAMASGMPVVSTVHAGIPELVTHGVSGFLAPERDVDALESCLAEAIERGGAVVDAARDMVEREFNAEIQNRRLLEVYAEIDPRFAEAAATATEGE